MIFLLAGVGMVFASGNGKLVDFSSFSSGGSGSAGVGKLNDFGGFSSSSRTAEIAGGSAFATGVGDRYYKNVMGNAMGALGQQSWRQFIANHVAEMARPVDRAAWTEKPLTHFMRARDFYSPMLDVFNGMNDMRGTGQGDAPYPNFYAGGRFLSVPWRVVQASMGPAFALANHGMSAAAQAARAMENQEPGVQQEVRFEQQKEELRQQEWRKWRESRPPWQSI
jgi:hypothetical protein